jgi:hypothetical protein
VTVANVIDLLQEGGPVQAQKGCSRQDDRRTVAEPFEPPGRLFDDCRVAGVGEMLDFRLEIFDFLSRPLPAGEGWGEGKKPGL